MDYIHKKIKLTPGCIFEFASNSSYSKEGLILYRDQTVVILLNRFPYTNGHLLVAPKKHLADLCELSDVENSNLIIKVKEAVAILRHHLKPDGLNIGLNLGQAAGAGLADHLHYHIVPRWDGDHNFMTVINDIRTIPEHIDKTFDLLLPDFQKITHKPTN